MSKRQTKTVRGLPGELPEGEHVLWQGSPHWRAFAVRVFHTRFVAGYFLILMAWSLFETLWQGGTVGSALATAGWLSLVGALALGFLGLLAWLFARTTIYTLTNKRIAMRYGVALPMTINIPLRCISSAGLRLYPNGTGDIPFQLAGPDRFAYLHLWPNARPWRFSQAEPMVRAVPQAEQAAQVISNTLEAFHAEQDESAAPAPKKVRTGVRAKKGRRRKTAAESPERPLAAAE